KAVEHVEGLPDLTAGEKSYDTIEAARNLLYFKESPTVFSRTPLEIKKTYEDKGVQVNTYDDFTSYGIEKLMDSDYKCRILTGVINLAVFQVLVATIAKVEIKKTTLNSTQKVSMLMKLKLDLSFSGLAVFFNISSNTARSYFYCTVQQASVILKPLIKFPSKEEILSNMPICFNDFRSTRVILDCTEISIEESKCLRCRIRSYSNYKGTHTVKYLIGIASSGLITFLSKGYGGRASDKAIFNAEHLIDQLDPGDAIMVNKGILIEKECMEKFVKLIYPPFLKRNAKQFSKEDPQKTASIARARVHVKRAIQRLKIFKICQGKLLWTLLPYMDDIMIIIAGLTNLGPPILAQDKF
ncbi:hypothetical protein ILUMI_14103, partial [Ignelater luminosus]